MEKQTIRLNESQLRQMIAEAINELDWKTYANAAKKAREQGNVGYWREKNPNDDFAQHVSNASDARIKSDRFGHAAMDAFNRDYGYDKGTDKDWKQVRMGGDFGATEEFGPHIIGRHSRPGLNPSTLKGGWKNKGDEGWNTSPVGFIKPEDYFDNDEEAIEAYRNGGREIQNYERGNYEYTPEQGWHLKDEQELNESIKRNIRKYLTENEDGDIVSAIANSCGISYEDAKQELQSCIDEIHSWMRQGVDPQKQTGYGSNYFEEQLENLGLDYDWEMTFAEMCYNSYQEPNNEYIEDLKKCIEEVKSLASQLNNWKVYFDKRDEYFVLSKTCVPSEVNQDEINDVAEKLNSIINQYGYEYRFESGQTMGGKYDIDFWIEGWESAF